MHISAQKLYTKPEVSHGRVRKAAPRVEISIGTKGVNGILMVYREKSTLSFNGTAEFTSEDLIEISNQIKIAQHELSKL
jgi:hypothetical protein